MAPRSRGLGRRRARIFLCKLQLGPKPDFKFELLPLHSPLLGQSLLVSFPPLIDMLKFSGSSYLIRGQPWVLREGSFNGRCPRHALSEVIATTLGVTASPPLVFRACGQPQVPNTSRGLDG